jgi:hypothetical protein
MDRSGVVHTSSYNVKDNPLPLLRIITGFIFANNETVGYDLTMPHGKEGEIKAMRVMGEEYCVVEKISPRMP